MSRLTGGDFAIFLPDVQQWVAESVTSTLTDRLRQVAAEGVSLTDQVGHVGVSVFDGSVTLARILSEADAALAAARQTGPNAWNIRVIAEITPKTLSVNSNGRTIVARSMSEELSWKRNPSAMRDLNRFCTWRYFPSSPGRWGASLFMPFAEGCSWCPRGPSRIEKVSRDRRQLPANVVVLPPILRFDVCRKTLSTCRRLPASDI